MTSEVPPGRSQQVRPARATLYGYGAVAGGSVAVATSYLVGVRTSAGRRTDAKVVRAAERASWPVRDTIHGALTYASGPVLIAIVAAIVWHSYRNGRRDNAVRTVGLVVSAALLTEAVKVVLPRPGGENTLPSGHVTLVAAVAVAGALTAPAVQRRRWGTVGCGAVALVAVGTWIIGWHRPSDVVAATGVVAICGGVSSLLGMRPQPPTPPATGGRTQAVGDCRRTSPCARPTRDRLAGVDP